MVHQRAQDDESSDDGIAILQACPSAIVHGAVTRFDSGVSRAPVISAAVVPVDLALSKSGVGFAVIAAGNAHNAAFPQVLAGRVDDVMTCGGGAGAIDDTPFAQPVGEAIAVAFDGAGQIIVQTREPATLQRLSGAPLTIGLSRVSRHDTGHAVFHANVSTSIACASCHPEGGEDGRTWILLGGAGYGRHLVRRRTMSLRDGVLTRAPFHWAGDLNDVGALVSEVYHSRMSGPPLDGIELDALSAFLGSIPAIPSAGAGLGNSTDGASSAASIQRGATLFASPDLACTSCHATNGAALSTSTTVDVGTSGAFKTPSLLHLQSRLPLLHDGCARTIDERFGACGGGEDHGHTAQLGASQRADLVHFLESL
jgi:cytochrome c553